MGRSDCWSPSSTMTTNLTMEPPSPCHFTGQPAMVHPHTIKFIDVTTDILPPNDAIAKQGFVAGLTVGGILNDSPAGFSFVFVADIWTQRFQSVASDGCLQRVVQCLPVDPDRLDPSFNKPLTSFLIQTRRTTEVLHVVSQVMIRRC
jgi:hypothetical protein